jgi:hypothetical protein
VAHLLWDFVAVVQNIGYILLRVLELSKRKYIMLTTQELIDKFDRPDGFRWGIDTAMQSLRPGCLYSLQAGNGQFEITDWPENQWSEKEQQYINAPTSQEIRDEYIRHKTIAEVLDYLKTKGESK